MFIHENEYKEIIKKIPILCVDIILRYRNQVLLVKRVSHPAKGVYWPIGGRVHLGESAEAAARRKILEEIGVDLKGPLIPIGYYEDNFTASSFEENTEYSTFSLVFVADLNREGKLKIKLDSTSEDFGFFDTLPKGMVIKRFSDFDDVLQDWK
jgi:ADP-ribose pyrophosphatase YjhB (NUDIX family)